MAGIFTWLTILLFKHLIKIGRQTRRSVFVVAVTTLMTVCGLVIGLVVNSGLLLVVIFTLSFATWGVMISLIVSLALYRKKKPREQ